MINLWADFHTPKNLVMALSVEVENCRRLFQWLTPEQAGVFRASP